MQTASPLFRTLSAALLATGLLFAAELGAQTAPEHHHHGPMPAPSNLQVLPKTMTGEQVHELMHQWEAELGTECTTCHAADPTRKAPNGKPMLDFAADKKPEKATARVMVRMVEEINSGYIAKIDNSGEPVTCGTCHRGHLTPEPFTPPPDEDHDHDHAAPAGH